MTKHSFNYRPSLFRKAILTDIGQKKNEESLLPNKEYDVTIDMLVEYNLTDLGWGITSDKGNKFRVRVGWFNTLVIQVSVYRREWSEWVDVRVTDIKNLLDFRVTLNNLANKE